MPLEGEHDGVAALAKVVREHVPTCGLDDDLAAAQQAITDSEIPFAVVVDDDHVVHGVVHQGNGDEASPVTDVLVEGPTSVRADSDLDSLVERMRKAGTGEVLVTTGQGELVGVLLLADVE